MDSLPDLTDEEIQTLARRIVTNEVYVPPNDDALRSSFQAILMLGADKIAPIADQIGMVYEEYDKAMPRSINGWPCFFSVQFVNNTSTPLVLAKAKEMYDILHGTTDEDGDGKKVRIE